MQRPVHASRDRLVASALLSLLILGLCLPRARGAAWASYQGGPGPGQGKHIVLITGDEEYRSEEAMPMLAKILSQRHGFRCTVLFSIHPEDGTIDPNNQTNIPGMHLLPTADLVFLFTRFREWPDTDMKFFVDYLQAGKPLVGIRTATHAFQYSRSKDSPYAAFDFRSQQWPGGFGRQVLGDTWINHHGNHGQESTRGLIDGRAKDHPILKGVHDIWGPTDVYGILHLRPEDQILVHGVVLTGMNPEDPPNLNKSMMPLIWWRQYQNGAGSTNQVLCSTIGAAPDLLSEDLRRLFINAAYWLVGLEDQIPQEADARLVGEYQPSFFGFNKFKHGVKPQDHELP